MECVKRRYESLRPTST